jgi:hypothetical protein
VTTGGPRAAVLIVTALALAASGAGTARADELDRAVEAEIGLGFVFSSSDVLGLGGYAGVSLGKPILDVCYLEPVVSVELDVGTRRFTAMIRCNFVTSVGSMLSLGLGAGTGSRDSSDDPGNTMTTTMSFREVEVGLKIGGKSRFSVGLALAFDGTTGDPNVVLFNTTLVRAFP